MVIKLQRDDGSLGKKCHTIFFMQDSLVAPSYQVIQREISLFKLSTVFEKFCTSWNQHIWTVFNFKVMARLVQ